MTYPQDAGWKEPTTSREAAQSTSALAGGDVPQSPASPSAPTTPHPPRGARAVTHATGYAGVTAHLIQFRASGGMEAAGDRVAVHRETGEHTIGPKRFEPGRRQSRPSILIIQFPAGGGMASSRWSCKTDDGVRASGGAILIIQLQVRALGVGSLMLGVAGDHPLAHVKPHLPAVTDGNAGASNSAFARTCRQVAA